MRAFVNSIKMTKLMQHADLFSQSKVIYVDLDLTYTLDNILVKDEAEIIKFAKFEFKDNLILLFGEESPLYINPNVQVVSTGEEWIRLIDVIETKYPTLEFEHDNHFMHIQIKGKNKDANTE